MNLPETFVFPTSQGRAIQLTWSALTGCSLIWAELSFKVSYYKFALGEQEGTRCQPIVRACLLLLLSEPDSLSTPLRFYPESHVRVEERSEQAVCWGIIVIYSSISLR